MKKYFITIIALVYLFCCAGALTSCGDRSKPRETPAHTCSFGEWASDGYTTHTRSCLCGESETQNHVWDNGTITTPPTCKDFGVKTYTCTVCKDTNTEQTDKNDHSFTAWADDGDDNHKRICSCGASETEPHDFSNGNCVCGKAKPVITTVGLEYFLNYDSPTYAVTGIGTATDTEIVVPSVYNGKPVTAIYNYAFQNNDSIVSIKIPDSVLYIHNAAFKDCSSLKSITIGSGLKAIDPEAFMNCPIETATIPAFACAHLEKSALKTVVISSGTAIADSALKDCTELASITIGDTVTSIGIKAFQNCRSLDNIAIPDGVESIGAYAFAGCSSLASITVDASNPNYASQDGILYNKEKTQFVHVPKAITKVVIPDGITSLDGGFVDFDGYPSLSEIIIPSGVTSVGFGVFFNCTALVKVTIPDTVSSIAEDAFANCSALALIRFNGTKEQWNAVTKENNWDFDTGTYIVRCADGDVVKQPT